MDLNSKFIRGYKYELNILYKELNLCSNAQDEYNIKKKIKMIEKVLNYFDKEQ